METLETKKRILIVDDEPQLQSLLTELLSSMEHAVVGTASNGAEALRMYKELKPDLVTMDVIMPEVDGLQALKDILAFDSQARVIMLTALDSPSDVKKLVKAGALDYIIKPFDRHEFLAAIRKALATKI